MRVLLITPSNKLFMPYFYNYTSILEENDIKFQTIIWDRMQMDEESTFTFKDNKKTHKRSIWDYIRYSNYIKGILDEDNDVVIVVFGLQLYFFLQYYLIRNFKGKFVLDIRDHHRLVKFINFKRLEKNSKFIVISSEGFKKWIPQNSAKIIVNHNSRILDTNELASYKKTDEEKIVVSYIGTIVRKEENINLINALRDSKKIRIEFNGEGIINEYLHQYIKENDIGNVLITGRYLHEYEENLYRRADFVNAILFPNNINNTSSLPNRLYRAIEHGKFLLVFEGSYVAEIVNEFQLGLTITNFSELENQIDYYLENYSISNYNKGRNKFIQKVINDNMKFKKALVDFCNKSDKGDNRIL